MSYQRFLLVLASLLISISSFSQADDQGLPKGLSQEEKDAARLINYQFPGDRGIETPPSFNNIRTAAEWEEIQALTIAWQGYTGILKQIVAASVNECEVIVLSEDPAATETFLLNNNWGGPVDLSNVTIIQTALNSIWMRDYGANTVYGNEVDDLFLVDWIYNRPRPDDDVSPEAVANYLGLDIYSTTAAPNDLMNTGGNYMSDGFGKAFCSELVIEENQGGNTGWGPQYPNQTEAQIDGIMSDFMGINEYIKMTMLPFDGIHHIDMHMKLLNEETILVSEYPEGVADGPQIEANLQYVLNNFTTKWGTPFKVVRVPVPPQESNGLYPDQNGWYCTYTNSVFVNNTVLLPTYYEAYDTIAIRIYEENLPGYNIVPIDCDDAGQAIISASGAIHCITQSVGVEDPLLISYEQLPNTNINNQDYSLQAYINHRSGIASANLYYKTDINAPYTAVAMSNVGNNHWEASIPAQAFGTRVYYYVEGNANSGKSLNRPMPAPQGFYSFDVINEVFACTDVNACNYDPLATIDDGSCELAGCTDETACNFNPNALCDDGSCTTQTFTLTLSTDCWGEEVTWSIANDQGNIVATDPPGDYADQTTFTESFCLSPNCYTFTILDSYGDGMNGSAFTCAIDGDYSFSDDQGNLIFQMEQANYGNGTSHSFCVEATEILGCIDSNACNFNPAATIEDTSCTYPQLYFFDGDGDGFGDDEISLNTCINPGNDWITINGDCDDARFDVNPLASGTGEGIDNNCNGNIDPEEALDQTPCFADLNNDGIVTAPDLLILLGDFGCMMNCSADITGDAVVNSADVLALLAMFGNNCD
jgi:agmatine/peptidylarginine deiminase